MCVCVYVYLCAYVSALMCVGTYMFVCVCVCVRARACVFGSGCVCMNTGWDGGGQDLSRSLRANIMAMRPSVLLMRSSSSLPNVYPSLFFHATFTLLVSLSFQEHLVVRAKRREGEREGEREKARARGR